MLDGMIAGWIVWNLLPRVESSHDYSTYLFVSALHNVHIYPSAYHTTYCMRF